MVYLGIDYGKKKVGLALSEGLLATPYSIITVSSLADAINKINAIIKKENIEQVVIGKPDSGEVTSMVENFVKNLDGVNVIVVDETLSSARARDSLIELGIPRKKRGVEDGMAAAIILQNYLDAKKS